MTTNHHQSHYIPNTLEEQEEMLASLGLTSIDQLFADIPQQHRNPPLDLPNPPFRTGNSARAGRTCRQEPSS